MTIQWFPGHMAKAIKQLKQTLKSIDILIDCRDARCPLSCAHPDVDEVSQHKHRVIVLTKTDLISSQHLAKWVQYFNQLPNHECVPVNAKSGQNVHKIIDIC